MKKFIASAFIAAVVTVSAHAQIVTPSASPSCKVEQRVGVTDVTLNYSRPSLKGRKIFGDHLNWGEIWRFGANSSTKIKFSDSVKVGGTWLKAGEYALYATPMEKTDWVVYFGREANVQAWDFKPENAAAKLLIKPVALTTPVETFTLEFTDLTQNSANLTMMWDKVAISIPFQVEVDGKVMASINKTMGDVGPYWAAASYYLENNKDMKQALEWTNRVLEKNQGYWVYLAKAKMQKKLGQNKEAIATAEIALAKAKEDKDNAYIKQAERFIADTKAGK